MLPSMPLISTPCKEGHSEESCSNDQDEIATKALDLSLSPKKSSPLKHVTPILRKYNTQRKGKKMGAQCDQMQSLRPIAPKPVMVVIAPTHEDPQSDSGSEEVKQETAEASDANKPEGNKKDNEDELAALMRASTTIQSAKGRVSNVMRKKTKQVRDMEASVMLLTPDDPVVREEKSYGFAQAYFLKVKERLEGTELYQAFLHTMNEFGTSIIEVRDLYHKVTSLLSQHPDLSEEFLAFLLPEQAMQCGKLMEYLMITRMRDFFRKLEMYFEKQPQQMRKFYSALSTLCGQADVSLTDVRSAILPLLKGNSVLIDNFLNLLPEEKPPDSMMTEFEDMEIGDCNRLKDDDSFETLVVPNQQDAFGGDSCACSCHQASPDNKTAHCLSCGTRFIHGKIFLQTGKVLRPAKVEFDTETAYQSMKRLSAKTRPKVRSRKRTTIRFGNSPLKRAHVASGSSDGNKATKGSRAAKAKSSPKARTTKSCRRLVKSKSQNASRQTSGNSPAKSSQSRTPASEKTAKNAAAKSVSNVISPVPIGSSCDEIPPHPRSDMIPTTETVPNSSEAIPHDESAILPPVVGSSDLSMRDMIPTTETVPNSSEGIPHDESAILPPVVGSSDLSMRDMIPTTETIPNSSEAIPHDESAILPPFVGSSDSSMRDFSLLSSVLQRTCNDSSEQNNLSVAVPENSVADVSPLSQIVQSSSEEQNGTLPVLQTVQDVEEISTVVKQPESLNVLDTEMKDCNEIADCVVNKIVSNAWTRDEDKVILQMYKMEHSFQEISEHLPQRSVDEIQSRFEILINIMKQMSEEKMEQD